MKATSDPAAVPFGPFLFEPLNGGLLRAHSEPGVPATRQAATELDVTLQWASEVRRQVPMVRRPLPVVR